MDSPLEPSNFNLNTDDGKTKYFMTAQAELFNCLSEIEGAVSQLTSIVYSIDFELSTDEKLKDVDNVLHKYIVSWQTLHLYYQAILKIKNIESPKYYQDSLYTN